MPRKVLTAEMVKEARRRVRAGETTGDVARDMDVKKGTLYSAIAGDTWARITDPKPVRFPGGGPSGTANGKAKLTPDDVREARRRYAAGETPAEIAQDMPVSKNATYAAIRGYSWKHITDPPPVDAQKNVNNVTGRQSQPLNIPDGATPCARCGLLTVGHHCGYCIAEGHARARRSNLTTVPYMGVV